MTATDTPPPTVSEIRRRGGVRGAVTFLSKVTAVCAALFFVTSLGLSFVGLRGSVAARIPVAAPQAPVPPATPAPAGAEKGAEPQAPAGAEQQAPAQPPPAPSQP